MTNKKNEKHIKQQTKKATRDNYNHTYIYIYIYIYACVP